MKAAPNRKFRLIMIAPLVWLGTLCLMGAWWGRLLLRQAGRIAELEHQLGLSVDRTQDHWHRVQRMLFWESSVFFCLVLVSTLFLFWLYWKDIKRSKGVQTFFASVTHELRTPLTSIRLQAESIAEEQDLKLGSGAKRGPIHSPVQRLIEDTIRLESQVERTLELARLEGGGPVHSQVLQLKPWLDRFVRNWKAHSPSELDVDLLVEDVVVEADPNAMNVILKNLFENSLRHSKRHSKRDVKNHIQNQSLNPAIKIKIRTENYRDSVYLHLEDDGSGYPGELESLGKLFYKGPNSQGTGVGLYLVKVLMRKMGGRVKFYSAQLGFGVSLAFKAGTLELGELGGEAE